jgi:hypothetical protein
VKHEFIDGGRRYLITFDYPWLDIETDSFSNTSSFMMDIEAGAKLTIISLHNIKMYYPSTVIDFIDGLLNSYQKLGAFW